MTTTLIIIIWIILGTLTCLIYKVFVPEHFENKDNSWQRVCFLVYFLTAPVTIIAAIIHMFFNQNKNTNN